jgi:1-acyl-sn-glycerol-3-phosphate acyltransferase
MKQVLFKLSRVRRVLGTGISFATFMVGGLLIALLVFPLVRIWPSSPAVKGRRLRRLLQLSFIVFVRWMTFLGVMTKPRIQGIECLARKTPCLIIANHPTLIDVVLLVSLIPDCNCVVKRALWEHFFLGGVVRAAEYVPNDAGPQLIRHCQNCFAQGRSLLIFPEGTRSPENGRHAFNRGAAQIALRAGVPVVPVTIGCHPPTLMKHQKWYEVPAHKFQMSVRFHSLRAIPAQVLAKTERPQQARALTRYFEDFYQHQDQVT